MHIHLSWKKDTRHWRFAAKTRQNPLYSSCGTCCRTLLRPPLPPIGCGSKCYIEIYYHEDWFRLSVDVEKEHALVRMSAMHSRGRLLSVVAPMAISLVAFGCCHHANVLLYTPLSHTNSGLICDAPMSCCWLRRQLCSFRICLARTHTTAGTQHNHVFSVCAKSHSSAR